MNFREWLSRELERNDWSQRELSRRSGISPTGISEVLSGAKNPTWDFCAAVGKALGERAEDVFRIAGLLPPSGGKIQDLSEEEGEIVNLWRRLPAGTPRQLMLNFIQGWVKENEIKGE